MEKQLEKPFEFPKIGELASPYTAYRELLLQQYTDKIDPSQLDAVIAMRMRLAGYARGFVAKEIGDEAAKLRRKDESRDWHDYARDTAYYAFGVAGDIDIAAEKPTPEHILAFHQAAERLEAARMGPVEEVWEAPRPRMR